MVVVREGFDFSLLINFFIIICDCRQVFDKTEHCMTTLRLSIQIFNYHRKVLVVIKMSKQSHTTRHQAPGTVRLKPSLPPRTVS